MGDTRHSTWGFFDGINLRENFNLKGTNSYW